jgi:outer membrane protein OmpA-like peptidoglycan-associated protein
MNNAHRVAAAALAACVATSLPAHAELQVAQSERYLSTMDAKGLARTHSGALLGHLELDAGLWGNYERNPMVVRDPDRGSRLTEFLGDSNDRFNPSRRRVSALVQSRVATELTFSLGLFNWVQLFGALPMTWLQDRGKNASRVLAQPAAINEFNIGDIRLGGKIRILRAQDQFVDLAFIPQLTLPVGLGFHVLEWQSPNNAIPRPGLRLGVSPWAYGYTSDGFPTLSGEFALSKTFYGVFLGGNAGLKLRRPYELFGSTISQELLLRAGVGFKGRELAGKVPWMKYLPVELGLEAAGAFGIPHPYVAIPYVTPGAKKVGVVFPRPFQPFQHAGEITATAGVDVFWLHPYVGAAVGVLPGWGTPDFRVLGGVRLSTEFASLFKKEEKPKPQPAPAPVVGDRDGDGILDDVDACVDVPGVPELKGCPVPPPGDADGDGILDPADACPADAEDKDGFKDEDGCPDPDNDDDGVPDEKDAAPNEPEDKDGFEDADGKPDPDNDQDGVPDASDTCPEEAEDKDHFQDEDGCPDPDNDGDGLLDDKDQCPADAEDKDGFQDEDGCPDVDNDHDGIPDTTDKCPLEPETINGNQDEDGCPDKGATKVQLTKERIVILDKVYFDTGKATIQKRSFNLLGQVASILKANPDIRVAVEGHTDSQGNANFNLDLSRRRAESVRAFLVEKGVAKDRLDANGYGLERPVKPNTTAKGREANRRVEFVVLGKDGEAQGQIKPGEPVPADATP